MRQHFAGGRLSNVQQRRRLGEGSRTQYGVDQLDMSQLHVDSRKRRPRPGSKALSPPGSATAVARHALVFHFAGVVVFAVGRLEGELEIGRASCRERVSMWVVGG